MFFWLMDAPLLPNAQTWNILAGELNKSYPNFSKSEYIFLFVLHHNLKVPHTMLFPASRLYPMPSLFLPAVYLDQGDENKIYLHTQAPYVSNFGRSLPLDIFSNPTLHKVPAT